ncbi:MAG: hypothetical protein Q4G42_02765 [Neisseria sp.]|nr:hypothetical protein [Neisseria sp.]
MALTSSKPSLEQTQQELDQIEVFRTLKSKDRATYDAIAATIYRNVEQNQSFDTTVWQAIQALDASLQKYIVRTSDTALRNYLNALTIQLKTLRAHDPNLCYHILYQPQGRLEEMNKVLQQSRRQEQAVMSALNQVILDYDPARPLPSEAETQIYLEATFLKISEKYGADAGMLANPTAPGTDKAKLCDMSIDLFDTLMAYPDPHATNSWKVLLSTE